MTWKSSLEDQNGAFDPDPDIWPNQLQRPVGFLRIPYRKVLLGPPVRTVRCARGAIATMRSANTANSGIRNSA